MRINAINYNNFYNKSMGNNSNNVAFNGCCCGGSCSTNARKVVEKTVSKVEAQLGKVRKPIENSVYYMEPITDEEIGFLSGYANSLIQKILPENLMLGPTFDIVEKVAQTKPKFSSFQEFIQLALRAENNVTDKMILKAKYFSSLCAEKYPKEDYAKEVDEILSQIEKSEPAALENISSNPLWNYTNILQRQADWLAVKKKIAAECDKVEKRVNARIDDLEDTTYALYYNLKNQIHSVEHSIMEEIDRLHSPSNERIVSQGGPCRIHYDGVFDSGWFMGN